MKALEISGSGQVTREHDWPDDFTPESIEETARQMLHNYYKAEGADLVPRREMQPVPYEIRVVDSSGKELHRVSLGELAKFLGLNPP
jgi:hypothetical protein